MKFICIDRESGAIMDLVRIDFHLGAPITATVLKDGKEETWAAGKFRLEVLEK